MEAMTAAVITRHGGPEVISVCSLDRPEPAVGEARIKVLACALGGLDVFVRNGMPGVEFAFPHIAGGQVVGIVDACGDRDGEPLLGRMMLVDPELPGGGTLGEMAMGGLAEYVLVPTTSLIDIPQDGDPVAYATLAVGYATAHRMLVTHAKLEAGETVAILGAAGGVGVACVQLARLAGACVIACSSSAQKLARLRAFGAGEVIDTSTEDFGRRIWQITEKRGADVVIDYIGRETLSASIRAAAQSGRVVVCGATTGFHATVDLRYLWAREVAVLGSNGWQRGDLKQLVELVSSGTLEPVVHAVFPLSKTAAAFIELDERRALGTVVVVPDDSRYRTRP